MKSVELPFIRAFDNGGETFDRYTLCFEGEDWCYAYGASEDPMHPCGFAQFLGEFDRLPELGRPVAFDDLPEKVQAFVRMIEREVEA